MAKTTTAARREKAKPAKERADQTLVGSDVQPAEIEINGKMIPLGEIVALAHFDSKLTAADWNALPDAEREAQIAATIDELRAVARAKAGLTRAVLIVRAKQPSRWRAGRHFTRAPVELNAADLTDAEIAAIEADPMLIASREERPAA